MAPKQRYFIELAYDGTCYHGWQIQNNAVSVQAVLNKALSTILREPIETLGCGRTDTGVHARRFYAHFDCLNNEASVLMHVERNDNQLSLPTSHEPVIRSLNAILPADISIKSIIPIHADAHARFDATLRSYQYHVHFNKDPFKKSHSWQLRDMPDIGLMNIAAGIIKEYTDFSCFSKSNTQVKTNNCKVQTAEWIYTDGCLAFHISADRFLRNMVRAIVGTLLLIGHKEIEPEAIRTIIEGKNRNKAGMSVPACGLYLTEIIYPYL